MKIFFAALAATVLSLLCATPATARWSAPQSFPAPLGSPAIAVDGHGDAAVAWARGTRGRRGKLGGSVHVAVRTPDGRLRTGRVWSSHKASVESMSVVVGHGEVTLAWIVYSNRSRRAVGGTVFTAYGRLSGRWRPARAIGHQSNDFGGFANGSPPDRYPRLAVAPDGKVLLAWDDDSRAIDGVAVAWRTPGHRFGVVRALDWTGDLGPIPAFDAGGTAYVSGDCDGVVFRAPPHSRRFRNPVVLAPDRALSFSLSVAGRGQGLASWVGGSCTSDAAAGVTPGPVFASILRAGRFGKRLAISSTDQSTATHAAAIPGGEAAVGWATYIGPFSVRVGAEGTLGAVQQITDGLVPFAADDGGDQVLTRLFSGPPALFGQGGVVVRPAGGGADEPAPMSNGSLAVATPIGRAAALAWNPTGGEDRVALSVWRP